MQIPVKDIIVKKRIRREYGGIQELADSMKRFGQISPITVNRANVLIAGERRLEAAKFLGWRTINATVVDVDGKLARLELEIEENIQRRDFTGEEIAGATRELYRLKNPNLLRRILGAIVLFFKRLFRIGG
ncbi:MAG: ParB N-terminal domain-containing protein [Treponema sp.]|jgi:ParB family chromosome partitioning protein|nr:ParB N-terminal domain-containing protein [Treponema sp.]